MSAERQSSGVGLRYRFRRKPVRIRSLSPVYLPTDIWLLLPPLLIQADIRALARVCMRLRMVFRPLVKFKVTIIIDDSCSHRKALAITRIATFLDSVVELEIGGRARYLFQVQYLFSPALFTLAKALPAMRQLHTLRLSSIFLPETYLYCILSSPHLTHLILFAIQMPKISRFPPLNPNLRKLTLELMVEWDAVRPLIVHLAVSLEYLEFRWCGFGFWPRSQPQLPSFPSLRELRRHQHYGDVAVLDELFHVSQVTHLHLSGALDFSVIAVPAFPKSLQHLSIAEGMLTQRMLGTTPLTQLISLSIRRSQEWEMSHHLAFSAFVCDHFPNITFLHLDIEWSRRNAALIMARSQHNVRAMELSIVANHGLPWSQVEILNDHLRNNMLSGALQSLRLDVFQCYDKLERSLAECSQWIDDDILHPVTGLGGLDLKSIEISFVQPVGGSERERRIWKRWDKLPDGAWRMEGAVCDNRDTKAAFIAALVTS